MRTKIFTLLLAVAASIGTLPAAIVNGTCGENLTWSLNTRDSTLTIEGYGDMTSHPWDEYKAYIAYVSLPNGLTTIEGQAFCGYDKLKSIIIPNSVTTIGDGDAWNQKGSFSNCTSLTSVILSNSMTSIGDYAFAYCTKLTSITIPYGITSIGEKAFKRCDSLTSIVLPNSVTNLGWDCFYKCTNLTSVTLSNGLTRIIAYAFAYCSNLTSIDIPNGITDIEGWAFLGCSRLSNVSIPNSVTNIGDCTFNGCSRLASIEIPNSVTSIGYGAFGNCGNLTTISLPKSITTIGHSAFVNCNLASITCFATTPPTISSNTFPDKSVPLFIPGGSIDAYQNALYWEEFTNISTISSTPLVIFLDWDGTILSSANVNIGSSATPPTNPTREGYTFVGWDKDFSNITEDLTVTAQYQINRYRVDFVDWDNTILKSDSVDWNADAIAPANPSREGYTFTGWDKEFYNVTEDLTINALYEIGKDEDFIINFNTEDGDEIISNTVVLKVPSAPEIVGFIFIGWRPIADFIVGNTIEIEAVYEANEPTSAPAELIIPSNKAQKLIRDGNVYILRGNKTYTIQGQEVK